jgi:HEAT repeat protein
MREEQLDDPVYTRWKRQHPQFPGVAKCIELLRRRNVRGGLVEMICHELQANATVHAAELIAAFRGERDDRVRRILLGIISEASLPEALPLLMQYLRSDDEGLRYRAIEGLRRLDTPETREVLWKAGYPAPTEVRG